MTMTKSNHEARLKFWASQTKEQRAERARKMVKARFAKMSKKQLSEYGKNLSNYRWHPELST